MRISIPIKFLLAFIIAATVGSCASRRGNPFARGEVPQTSFASEVTAENIHHLLIVPVNIKGEWYRFLFDTGAPLSISREIQEAQQFKVLKSGHVVDSDGNRAPTDFVQIDSLLFGGIPFTNQTAFVADFKANPLIECMGIDGIIGSNFMRHCNWSIDYQEARIKFFKGERLLPDTTEALIIPFTYNFQYDIFIDLEVQGIPLKEIQVDYGSNGGLSLTGANYQRLLDSGLIATNFVSVGRVSTGILGHKTDIEESSALVAGLQLDHDTLPPVVISTDNSQLLGGKILSQYKVTIDWGKQSLILREKPDYALDLRKFNFRIGLNAEGKMEVESVVRGSVAEQQGLYPGMLVSSFDTLNFDGTHTFCDFFNYMSNPRLAAPMMVRDSTGNQMSIQVVRSLYE